ncbi:MAG: hypothetical protein ABWX84_02230 [Nocardioides sp.]
MSYPQQPPSPSAYPSGPGDAPRRSRTVLAVVLAVVAVLVVALAGVAIAAAGDDEGGSSSAVAGGPASSTVAPTPTEAESVTPEPAPTETETEDPAPAPTGGKLKAAEYTKDWDFKLGDVALKAKHKAGWDYATCAPVAKGGKLKALGCRYAVEVTYTALGGKLQFTNLFLTLPSPGAAAKAVSKDKISDADFTVRDESFVPDYKIGKYRDNDGGTWVVITVATARAGVSEKQLENYLKYANTDFSSALLFRF